MISAASVITSTRAYPPAPQAYIGAEGKSTWNCRVLPVKCSYWEEKFMRLISSKTKRKQGEAVEWREAGAEGDRGIWGQRQKEPEKRR